MSVASSSRSVVEKGPNYCFPLPAKSTFRSSSVSCPRRLSRKVRVEDRKEAKTLRDRWDAEQLTGAELAKLDEDARAIWVSMGPPGRYNHLLGEILSNKAYTDDEYYDGIVPIAGEGQC